MIVVDEHLNIVTEPNLEAGELRELTIPEGFAWPYEDRKAKVYIQGPTAREKIERLKAELAQTDGDVLEALEGILVATSPSGLLSAISTAAQKLNQTLNSRNDLRAQIAAAQTEN